MTLSDPGPRFQGHGVTIDAIDVLCAQLMRNLFAIAKFLLIPYLETPKDIATEGEKLCPDDRSTVVETVTPISGRKKGVAKGGGARWATAPPPLVIHPIF